MSALLLQLALVSESGQVPMKDVMKVAAALQKQATRDLAPIWEVSATVDAFETLEDVPLGYWPMIVKDNIGFNAAGIHLDKDGQPYALITASSDIDTWALTASHETLESWSILSAIGWLPAIRRSRVKGASTSWSRSAIHPRMPSSATV
jgi:hypothetical protein